MKRLLLTFFFFAVLLMPNRSNSLSLYSIIDLGDIAETNTTASAINNDGVVVGSIGHQEGAFKWENGETTILPFLADIPEAGAISINDKEEIVGFSPLYNWHHAVMWDSENDINDLGGAGFANDINDNSQVVIESWGSYESFLWEDGSIQVIASYDLNSIDHSAPNAINENGQVVGWGYTFGEEDDYQFAYLWEDESLYNLNDLVNDAFDDPLTEAIDINNNGQIIGDSWLFENGNVLDLGFSGATAINEIGQIVGSSYLYENGQLYDLNEYIESDISYSDLRVSDINDLGQIVGSFDLEGETHAFLMDPVKFNVTFTSGVNGSISGELTQTIKHGGSTAEVSAVSDNEYSFISWSGDYEGSENPLTIDNITSDMDITANFSKNEYSVHFMVSGNGSITGEAIQLIESGENSYEVTAVPDIGYHFTAWTGDYEGIENPLTINNITANMSMTANFGINNYTITFFPGDHGGLSGDINQVVEHGGNSIRITAYPESGYHFLNWIGDYTGDENPLTLENVTSDMNITANYIRSYDGNKDGIPDALQGHVKNLTTEYSQNVTLEFDEFAYVNSYSAVDNPSPDDTPESIDFPYGFIGFAVEDVEIGEATIINVYLPEDTVLNTYYIYGSTPDNITPHWYEFLYDGATGAEINGNIITLHFVDGERGDNDLITNGIVFNDGGPGISLSIPSDASNVNSIQPNGSNESISLESSPGTTLTNCHVVEDPLPADSPPDITFPYGLLGFTIDGVVPGGITSMTLRLPEGLNPTTYYKYGPTPDITYDHWYEFMHDGETGAIINGNIITLYFVDGKRGDSDLDGTNGIIVDPGGPIINNTDNGGGGSGCFINSLAYTSNL